MKARGTSRPASATQSSRNDGKKAQPAGMPYAEAHSPAKNIRGPTRIVPAPRAPMRDGLCEWDRKCRQRDRCSFSISSVILSRVNGREASVNAVEGPRVVVGRVVAFEGILPRKVAS